MGFITRLTDTCHELVEKHWPCFSEWTTWRYRRNRIPEMARYLNVMRTPFPAVTWQNMNWRFSQGDYAVAQLFYLMTKNNVRCAGGCNGCMKDTGFPLWTRSVPFVYESWARPPSNQCRDLPKSLSNASWHKTRAILKTAYINLDDSWKDFWPKINIYLFAFQPDTVYKARLPGQQVLFRHTTGNGASPDSFTVLNQYLSKLGPCPTISFLAHNSEIIPWRAPRMDTSHNMFMTRGDSDSAKLENCMEYLYVVRSIPQSLMMMIRNLGQRPWNVWCSAGFLTNITLHSRHRGTVEICFLQTASSWHIPGSKWIAAFQIHFNER